MSWNRARIIRAASAIDRTSSNVNQTKIEPLAAGEVQRKSRRLIGETAA